MGLFKRGNQKIDGSATGEETAKRIAQGILSRQRKLADYLNGKAKALSARNLKIILLLFCGGFGTYCLYLLYGAIN